jgi:hypothetical protein
MLLSLPRNAPMHTTPSSLLLKIFLVIYFLFVKNEALEVFGTLAFADVGVSLFRFVVYDTICCQYILKYVVPVTQWL